MPVHLVLPRSMAQWVTPRPWLSVAVGDAPSVEFRGWRHPLYVHPLPPTSADAQLQAFAAALSQQAGALVARPLLPSHVRAVLEEKDVGYVDSRGNLHVVLPTGIIHADAIRGARSVSATGLGVQAVRAIQEVLARIEPFTVSTLAKDCSLSLARTHSLLQMLEREGFLRTTSAGAARLRTVTDRTALLDWLAAQPVARRREPSIDVVLYARRPDELWERITNALGGAGISHALSGGAAAAVFGTGPTNILTSLVRVDPDVPLEIAAQTLGGTTTPRGANLRLVRDTGRAGTHKSSMKGNVRVAPPVRIYLDALNERRGEDVANHFREVILGY